MRDRESERQGERQTLPGSLLYQCLIRDPVTVRAISLPLSLWLHVLGKSHVQPEHWCPPLPDWVNGPLSQDYPEALNILGLSLTQ